MRFFADGPSIPDELLVARDEGRVVFFCGSGVSRAFVQLPDFFGLASNVVNKLRVAVDSPARVLLDQIQALDGRPGMSGTISADRIFGLLEREFETYVIEKAVAEVLKPDEDRDVDLSAHRTLLDLATTAEGNVRLITTNFDRLFEACNGELHSWMPPRFPDITRPNDFSGIIHLHGLVNENSDGADGDGFVLSSSEFGHAYLADGWATEFVKAILDRYVVVFVGYAADDPPVQYLLEALNKKPGQSNGIFAFQSSDSDDATTRWYHKGAQAIAYSEEHDHRALWQTLEAWARRAKSSLRWYQSIVDLAKTTPEQLQPHERGQVAHVVSTTEGARMFAESDPPPPAEWLMVFDSDRRYAKPGKIFSRSGMGPFVDPFDLYGLDFDQMPHKVHPEDPQAKREKSQTAWDAFNANSLDRFDFRENRQITLRGFWSTNPPMLPSRLNHLSRWIAKNAHHPTSVWWAAGQYGLREDLRKEIHLQLGNSRSPTMPVISRAWRYLFEAWDHQFKNRDHEWYVLEAVTNKEGWNRAAVRNYAALRRPYLEVTSSLSVGPIPAEWKEDLRFSDLFMIDVKYPNFSRVPQFSEELLGFVTRELRKNLECAVQLETEMGGYDFSALAPIVPDETRDDLDHRSHGLTGAVMDFVSHFKRLKDRNASEARQEFASWPISDDSVFARLRIWAGTYAEIVPSETFGTHIASLSDEAFWDFYHQRDLLLVLAARWRELSPEAQQQIEKKLLSGSPRRAEESDVELEKRQAWNSLSYITWLTDKGCEFSSDLNSAIGRLRQICPDWKPSYAAKAADSVTMHGGWVKTDTEHSPLLDEPLGNIIAKAHQLSGRSIGSMVEKDPFLGLSQERPVQALAALTNAAKQKEYPIGAWSTFLRHDARQNDKNLERFSSQRLAMLIAERIIRCSDEAIVEFLGPAADWFFAVSDILASRYSKTFEKTMSRFLGLLRRNSPADRSGVVRYKLEPDWHSDAISSPVGRLAEALLKDPRTDGLKVGQGFPAEWRAYVGDLLSLPGDLRRYALAIFARDLNWFYAIDPSWTEVNLLSILGGDDTEDRYAALSGLFYGNPPDNSLYNIIKPILLSLTKEQKLLRREFTEPLAVFILLGWGSQRNQHGERYISNDEMHDVILRSSQEFRLHLLWHISGFLKRTNEKPKNRWAVLFLELVRDVWPRQKSIKSPETSARFVELSLANPELFPQIVEIILPLLTIIDHSRLFYLNTSQHRDQIIDGFPHHFLNLLLAVLPDHVNAWPYDIGNTLNQIAEADPKLQHDGRFIELQRKWNSR